MRDYNSQSDYRVPNIKNKSLGLVPQSGLVIWMISWSQTSTDILSLTIQSQSPISPQKSQRGISYI